MQSPCKFDQNVLHLSCDGVITDGNGLIYMRARYYSPDMRRFINADVVAGSISNAITLNRFAYANSNKATVKNEAKNFLKKSMMTETFRGVFKSNYDYKYVDSIADAFSEYLYSLN